jgi:hypothetical protein
MRRRPHVVSYERLDRFDAEHWIARWEREAEDIGWPRTSSRYWHEGWEWIERERNPPKTDMNAEGDDGQVYGG